MKKNFRKFRQALDRAIYEGRFKQFIWLGGVLVLAFAVVMSVSLAVGFDPVDELDGATRKVSPGLFMRVLELFLDPGAFTGAYNYGYEWLQLVIVLLGATFFTSFLIGAIGNLLNRRIETITSGQYSYDFEDHILILGSSSMLENLLKQVGGSGKDIVIQTTKDVERVRETIMSYTDPKVMRDVYVVFGKRTNPASLDELNVSKASKIYVVGEDDEPQHDGLNLTCWQYIVEKCAGCTDIKYCYLLLDRLTTLNVFSYRADSCSTDNLRLNIISAMENMSQTVFVTGEVDDIKYPRLDRDGIDAKSNVNVHLVLVDMTQVAYAMAITAAHICHFPNFKTNKKKTKITFIHKKIREELDFWMGHFDSLMDLSYAEVISWDKSGNIQKKKLYPKMEYINPLFSDCKGFLDIEWEFIDAGIEDPNVREYIRECVKEDGKSEYLSFAFCGHEAEDNMAASLYLPKEVYAKKEYSPDGDIPVFVYQPLTKCVLATAKKASRYSNLYPFGMRADCFDPQLERMQWAKKIKYLYKHVSDYSGMGTEKELEELWYHNKDEQYIKLQSNIYAANSVPMKFRSIGLDPNVRSSITPSEIAVLAEVEHNRWNVERLLTGSSALPFEERKNLLLKKLSSAKADIEYAGCKKEEYKARFMHPDIAPYEELLASSKEYDINIATHLLDIIK